MENKTSINLAELNQLLKEGKQILILDVRSATEYNEKHIPGAINIPVENIEAGNYIPQKDTVIVTACGKGGGRSERAAQSIRGNSQNKVFFLEGGTLGYCENKK